MNIFSTNCILKFDLIKIAAIGFVFAAIFGFTQYKFVVLNGNEPMYFFMNFNDGWKTYGWLAGIYFGAISSYTLLYTIDGFIKPHVKSMND